MVDAKLMYKAFDEDREMERIAWKTSLLMTATGNYGKKGIDPKKLYTRQFDDYGHLLVTDEKQGSFIAIDKVDKDNKLNELIAKFNN